MRLLSFMKRRSLNRDDRGIAAVEFGLTAPVLLILTLGGLEFAHFVIAHHQVRQIAAMTADNASRLRTQMSEAYVNQLFVGVDKAGAGLKFKERGRAILSSIQNNNAGTGQWIRWQRCFGQLSRVSAFGPTDTGRNDDTLPTVDGLEAQAGSAIMMAEARYMYQPLFRNPFSTEQEISHRIAFIVRQRSDFAISGTSPSTC